MAGIVDESLDPAATGAPHEYQSKSPLQQIWFGSAGVIMNLLLAFILFALLTLKFGVGEMDHSPVIGEVLPDYPAQKLGLQSGDRILVIDGFPVENWEDLTRLIHARAAVPVVLEWERKGVTHLDTIQTVATRSYNSDEQELVGMIGISPVIHVRDASVFDALKEGIHRTYYWLGIILQSIGMLFSGAASLKELGGPILIAQMAGESARAGFWSLLNFMGIISVNLAFLNILPIPGLDGGHILIAAIEGTIRRKLPTKVKMGIQQAGLLFLLMLFVMVMVNDLSRIF